jgi:hypothetical protein
MHIRKAGGMPNHKPLKLFTFIDTITRFGNMMVKEDLESACIRAGRAVSGNMRQNFLLCMRVKPFRNAGTSCSSCPTGSGRGGGYSGGREGKGYRF